MHVYIYSKLRPKLKKLNEQKVFFFQFYILCENFSKIEPQIKIIPKFSDDPLNGTPWKLYNIYIYIWDKRTAAFINKSQVGETFGYLQYRLKCTVKHNVSFFSSSVVLKGHYNRIKYLSALHRKYGRNFNNIVSAEFWDLI